jgi:hypothetical protein
MAFTTSPSGVRLAYDFRDNLIIDRYHPAALESFAGQPKEFVWPVVTQFGPNRAFVGSLLTGRGRFPLVTYRL